MLLFRLSNFWRIIGVVHSQDRYLENGVQAKPTPDKNPELSQKIGKLFDLLVQQNSMHTNTYENITSIEIKNSVSNEVQNIQPNETQLKETKLDGNIEKLFTPSTITHNNNCGKPADSNECYNIITDANCSESVKSLTKSNIPIKPAIESLQKISLPIPVSEKQRWFMLELGNDFTHIWFPSWRKFLGAKRMQSTLAYAAHTNKTIELSPNDKHPKVFATAVRNNTIFVGPYNCSELQDLCLFIRYNNRMYLTQNYIKQFEQKFTQTTTGKCM